MDEIIRVNGLSKKYSLYDKPIDRMKEALSLKRKCYHREFYALHDISFHVNRGEIVGIVGTNGSGKSTLLKLITNVLQPSEGELFVSGKISALLELGAGFNPEYTGMENIFLNGMMMGYSREEMEKRLQGILDFAQIGDFIHRPVKTYSSGMFARLAFAVAINVEPDILIVDETLSVGDMRFQLKCMDKMKRMMDEGTTVLFVSHDMNVIKRFCTRCIWINNGKLMLDGGTNEVTDTFLDFMNAEISSKVEAVALKDFSPVNDSGAIAEIQQFRVMNSRNQEVDEMRLFEPLTIELTYDVYDTNISNPVIGIAVKDLDDGQICGLNTGLDHVKIPWEYGRNVIRLHYPNGLRLLGGQYYFDAAIFDQTICVRFHYITAIKRFKILGDYIGEGIYIIPHVWDTKSGISAG